MTNEIFQLIIKSETAHIIESESFFKDNLCYIYLNGILSGAIAMPVGAGSSFTINSAFEFNSEYCDFDLYRFRVYELGLTMPQVIHNYLSDMHSIVLYD